MKKIILALLLLCAPSAWAQCAGVTSCSTVANPTGAQILAAMQSINLDNTVLSIPGGTSTISSTITYTATNSFTLQGAGAISSTTNGGGTTGSNATTFNVSATGTGIQINTIPGKSLRITGIFFNSQSPSNIMLWIAGSSTSVRVDHNHFFTNFEGFRVAGSIQGVADHDFFEGPQNSVVFSLTFHNGQTWNGSSDGVGDASWHDTDHWGTSQFFFVEDSRFTVDVSDGHDGARFVLRHSTLAGTFTNQHGLQIYNHGVTNDPARGVRAVEVYQNTLTGPTNPSCGGCGAGNAAFTPNSGTALFWGNNTTQYRGGVGIGYTCRNAPGSANGCNYTYPAPPTNWGGCGTTFGPSNWDQNSNSSGYACIDQPGRGVGDLLSGTFPNMCNITLNPACNIFTGQWPRQALSPIYAWANTYSTSSGFNPTSLVANTIGALAADNRDYYMQFGTNAEPGTFNGTVGIGQGTVTPTTAGAYTNAPNCTAGPGGNTPGVGWWNTSTNTLYVCTATNTWTVYYTPFAYPHPLAGGGGVIPPAPPSAPTGLSGTVSASTASLSWTASSGSPTPTAYTLYRGTVHGGPYSIVKSGLTSTSTTDTPPNGTWFYVVAAYVGGIITNISGSGSVATVTCTTSCAFPTSALVAIGGNSVAGFNTTTSSTGQPNSSSFTFASSTSGTGTGGGAWQTASESPKSNEITVTVPASLTVTLLPASRTFASQIVGTSSASQTAVLTNSSSAGNTVTISGKSITGANAGDYSQTNNCPSLLLSGTNCTFNITFTPTAAGTRTATLAVTDNAAGSPQSVALSGTGTAQTPGVSLNPTSLNFGDQTLSTTSTTRSIILTNTGSGTLTITSVVASGDFAVVTVPVTNCGGTLASLATCSLNVTFTPTATGGRTGAVTVTDNATGSPHVASLQGVGITTKCQATGNVTLSGAGSVCQ